jgi:hypothetical protein
MPSLAELLPRLRGCAHCSDTKKHNGKQNVPRHGTFPDFY